MKYFAAVGPDGRRPVVWGIGHTASDARQNARDYTDDLDLDTYEISHSRYVAIEGGDVSWDDEMVLS